MKGFGYIIVLVVLVASSIDQSESLQCYACASAVSLEACTKSQTKTTCPSALSNPRCLTMTSEVMGIKAYVKSCYDSSLCTAACPAGSCTRKCCNKNLCNSARSTMPALQGMLTTFAAVSIMLFFAY
eukprot:Seg1115.1 transcript_id=Seg1115.1/GoldUCD/mRNA.D3Y31 product="hypothetical protein" protein_id=Seg1115.1/GoldUCD/D3Y31